MKTRLSHWIQYGLIVALAAVLRCLPRRVRGIIGTLLGQVVYLIGIRVRVLRDNLVTAFPNITNTALHSLSGRIYRHWGRVAVGFAALPLLRSEDVGQQVFLENEDVLREPLKAGKGCIVVSGHLGNWELMGAIESLRGIPVSFVVTTQRNKLVERLVDRYRVSNGIEIIKRKHAVRGVLDALKRNRAVAILIDQDAHEDGVFVPFFGRPASTPRGPAVFHLRTGAPLVFAKCTRIPGERYRIQFQRVSASDIHDADSLTARLTLMLEEAIRESPEQWLWMHRRWKTMPPALTSPAS